VAVGFMGGSRTALSGPCTEQIDQLQQRVAGPAPAPVAGPTATQSVDAQLHHQPTPGSLGQAEHVANKDADAAIERARQADKANDATACNAELTEARRLYGINE
jgi:hypothetical protein